MKTNLTEVNTDLVVSTLVSSSGDLFLTIERLKAKYGIVLTEYDILDILTSDNVLADDASRKLRFSTQLMVFQLLYTFKDELVSNIDNIGPREIIRAFGSMLAAFSTLTAPSTKSTFDFALEAKKAADEFKLPPSEVEEAVKTLVNAYKK